VAAVGVKLPMLDPGKNRGVAHTLLDLRRQVDRLQEVGANRDGAEGGKSNAKSSVARSSVSRETSIAT